MARHVALQLLPAMTARTLVIVEGPHDRAGYGALWRQRWREHGHPLLADDAAVLIDAGDTSGSGGVGRVPHLAAMARELGFRVVAVIDGDPSKQAAIEALQTQAAADAVVRLPKGSAVEMALLEGLDEGDLRTAMADACTQHGCPFDDSLTGGALIGAAVSAMKSQQLHAQFVEALPENVLPGLLGCRVIDAITAAVRGADGVVEA
jgi:putative ATP-dependent endonuclease of the OLD family